MTRRFSPISFRWKGFVEVPPDNINREEIRAAIEKILTGRCDLLDNGGWTDRKPLEWAHSPNLAVRMNPRLKRPRVMRLSAQYINRPSPWKWWVEWERRRDKTGRWRLLRHLREAGQIA